MANTKPRILVVDDELDICNFVKAFFEVRKFDVNTALNGDEALSKAAQFTPDIVILDVMMRHGREGIEFLPRIKAALPLAKILMITGVDDQEIIDQALILGADDYITKPLVLEYLESTVMKKVGQLTKGS